MAVLRQVAKTDTFEKQRQVINALAQDLFSIGAGGSDLTTGFLKIGDGTIDEPSLSFLSDNTVGFYKPDTKSLGVVSGGKNLIDYKEAGTFVYRDLNVRNRKLFTQGVSIANVGQNYDSGNYANIGLIGGSGVGGTADFTVEAFEGTVTSVGSGYRTGQYDQIQMLTDGSGIPPVVSFNTEDLILTITNPGSGYTENSYVDVPLNSNSVNGSGIVVSLTIGTAGTLETVQITDPGNGLYLNGDTFTVSNSNLLYDDGQGGTLQSGGAGILLTVTSNPDRIDINTIDFADRGSDHAIGDNFTLAGPSNYTLTLPGQVFLSTTVTNGSSTFTVTTQQAASIAQGMVINKTGGTGELSQTGNAILVTNIAGTTITMSEPASADGSIDLDIASENISLVTSASSVANIVDGSYYIYNSVLYTISGVDPDTNSFQITPTGVDYADNVQISVIPPYGSGSGFNVIVDQVGVVTIVNINNGGNGYADNDELVVSPFDLTQPIQKFTTVFLGQEISVASAIPVSIGDNVNTYLPPDPESGSPAQYGGDLEVIAITGGSNGAATSFIASGAESIDAGAQFVRNGGGTVYTATNSLTANRYYIGDTEGGETLTPTFTLYAGSKYHFYQYDGSDGSHPLSFSIHPDGVRNIVDVTGVTLTAGSTTATLSSTAGILDGMSVTINGGSGSFSNPATVVSVLDSTSILLSLAPDVGGSADIRFAGVQYTEGVSTISGGKLISVTEDTPTPLYYYCPNHDNMGGNGQINISLLNPKTFGSNFLLSVSEVSETDVITTNVITGDFGSVSVTTTEVTTGTLEATTSLSSPSGNFNLLTTNTLESQAGNNLAISSANNIQFNSQNVIYGNITLNQQTSNITTSGEIKTTNNFNVNDILEISNNVISTTTNTNLVLTPGSGAYAKIDAVSAIVIPVGDNSGRPGVLTRQDGMIRYNTETSQFEGFSTVNGNGIWSSLGGVRDQDGNTTILAELTPGANDNTLWFINDDINTLTVNRNYLDFKSVKKIRSSNINAPSYTNWLPNVVVTAGQYLKSGNDIYVVVSGGQTSTSGNDPNNQSGDPFPNGAATLQYYTTAVSTLRFEEISEVQFGAKCPLSIQGDLRLFTNTISTDVNDLVLRPNTGLKVKVDAASSLVLPVGTEDDRGNAAQGSIRFSTTSSQFEGYDGTNWGSLGGVKDVNQNTYIEPETAPGADEDILYFYNNNSLSLQLTEQRFELKNVDTIWSENGTLALDSGLLTFNNFRAQLDTSSALNTKFTTTSDKLEFGFNPTGLSNETLLRVTETGEIWYNRAHGTGGNESYLRILNNTLTVLELEKLRTQSIVVPLERGVVNNGVAELYNPSSHIGSRVHAIAYNKTTGDKETMEFTVIDKGTQIYYYEIGNLKTGVNLVTPTFDFAPGGQVRVNFTINSSLAQNNLVDVVVISNIIKK